MRTIAIYGSSRNNGNTKMLVDYIALKFQIQSINLADYNIELYNYENNYNSNDYLSIINELVKYENIIFITPVYWYSISSYLKIFIDRFTDLITYHKKLGKQLRNKKIYLISQGYNYRKDNHFSDFLEKTCNYMRMNFIKNEFY